MKILQWQTFQLPLRERHVTGKTRRSYVSFRNKLKQMLSWREWEELDKHLRAQSDVLRDIDSKLWPPYLPNCHVPIHVNRSFVFALVAIEDESL